MTVERLPESVHLMGVGGIHMSAIAVLLRERGHRVSGCDLYPSPLTARLEDMGVTFYQGHAPFHLDEAGLLVYTSAIRPHNPELVAARERGLPALKRAEMVALLGEGREVIAVAGSHGKTTTTSLVAYILWRAGLSPTFLLGGEMVDLGTNVQAGQGPHFVVEADEYDAAFLHYRPRLAIVTNVEADHLDYYGSLERLRQAFARFASQVQPGGWLLLWGEDEATTALAAAAAPGVRVLRYGLEKGQELHIRDIKREDNQWVFDIRYEARDLGPFRTALPGLHNVRNCLAAIGASLALALPLEVVREAVQEFRGVRRRFELVGEAGGVTVMDDYAHHPTEIRATLAAARQRFPGRRLVCLFQPHTYTRTQYLLEGFRTCFRGVDCLLIAETYAAREEPSAGMTAAQLAREIESPPARYAGSLEESVRAVLDTLRPGDVFFTIGAGDVDRVGRQVLEALRG